jgi:hypothetical protein
MSEPNDPIYFHQLAEHANRYSLAYLAEAAPAMMGGAGLGANVRAYLSRLERLAREQYLDFARLRRFRQSLVCRSDAPTDFALHPSRMAPLFATASMALLQAASEGRMPRGNREPQASVHRDILEQLVARAPATIPVAELTGNAGAVASAEAMIMEAWMSGFVQFRTKPISATSTASTRPEAFALARLQRDTRKRHQPAPRSHPACRSASADTVDPCRRHP